MKKKALITGITGQIGSYLAELLLSKGYEVFGLNRRSSNSNTLRINHILKDISLISGDLGDQQSLIRAIEKTQPDEVYNLAAQSFVAISWGQSEYTMDVNLIGVIRLLEAIRLVKPDIRFYQSSTSEMFGKVLETPQTESTPFYPRSPYGVAKVGAYWATVNYRESYDMFLCNGILYNSESPRRGMEFVTKKIANGVAQIKKGLKDHIALGNLDSKRDWGHAKDSVRAMHLMLQQDKPDDYVISTGTTRSIKDFLDAAFKAVGIQDWKPYVRQDPKFMRPAEVDLLCGDATKAKEVLGWEPEISFEELVSEMVNFELHSKLL
jgi:GDPmannose 4,6-dehydratase